MSEMLMDTAGVTIPSLETVTHKINDILDNSIQNDHSFHTPTYRDRAAKYEVQALQGAIQEYMSVLNYNESVNHSLIDAGLKDQLNSNEHVRTLEEIKAKGEIDEAIAKGRDVRDATKSWVNTLLNIGGKVAVPLILSIL